MVFLYPIGLLALAGLIIPVLIHLWSVKQGKVLKIGSIALLGENATASSKSIQLTDILLFILRCLLIILLASVLAAPYLKSTVEDKQHKGWILIDQSKISKAYQTNRSTIDSLLNLGFELRDFNLGFNQFGLKDSSEVRTPASKLSYTALLNQLNKPIPAGYTAYIFADQRLVNFDGPIPKPSFKLVWKELHATDTLKTWTTKFLAKQYAGKSSPSLTNYTSNGSQNLPTLRALIYDPSGNDAKYISAVLYAISDFTKRKIEIKAWNSATSGDADVIFWLSENPIAKAKLKKGAALFSYQKGKVHAVNSTLVITPNGQHNIALTKRIDADNLTGEAVWTDGFGDPVLVKENDTFLNHFRFYSRFNPQWTDLVWDEHFVKAMVPLVLARSNDSQFGFEEHDADQRVLAKGQVFLSNNHPTSVSSIHATYPLTHWIWVIAFIVLIIERTLSLRRKTTVSYGRN
jgi:hypothetical protein